MAHFLLLSIFLLSAHQNIVVDLEQTKKSTTKSP